MAARILIADDNDEMRAAISQLVRNSGQDWEICGEAADGAAAVQKAADLKPDLVILDVMMPQRDGISAGRAIHAMLPGSALVLYTLLESRYLEAEGKQAGFHAVVQKSNAAALLNAIREALAARRFRTGDDSSPRGLSPA